MVSHRATHSLPGGCCGSCRAHPIAVGAPAVAAGKQGVEEGVDAAIAVGQAGNAKVEVSLGGGSDAQPLAPVQPSQLPGPEGEEASPIGHHDGGDPGEKPPGGGPAGRRQPQTPSGGPVRLGQAGVDDPQHHSGCQDAGGEKHCQIEPEGRRRPGGDAETLVGAVLLPQLGHRHHGGRKQEREEPEDGAGQLAVSVGGPPGPQRPGHRPVPLQAHGRQEEDAGVHGEEVQAEQKPAAHVAEEPVVGEVGADHEGDGGEVQKVSQGKVDHVDPQGAR